MAARSVIPPDLPRPERMARILELEACERRGRVPRREVIERALLALRDAIAERGGQRRARPYLARELRRLGLG
jgi:hypothetical protein